MTLHIKNKRVSNSWAGKLTLVFLSSSNITKITKRKSPKTQRRPPVERERREYTLFSLISKKRMNISFETWNAIDNVLFIPYNRHPQQIYYSHFDEEENGAQGV